MARERAAYRDNLELIRERAGDKPMLNLKEACAVVGLSYGVAKRNLPITGGHYVSAASLARWMCGEVQS